MRLSEEQRRIVSSSEPRIYVNSGAGCGKSTLISKCIEKDVQSGIKPEAILALSFGTDVREKNLGDFPDGVLVRTLHQYCWKSIENTIRNKSLIQEEERKRVIVEIKRRLKIKGKTEDFIEEIVKAQENPSRKMERDIQKVYREYRLWLKKNQKFEFSDMITEATEFFKINPPLKIKRIYVDEVQDMSEIQLNCLAVLMKTCSKIVCVGDTDQHIYGFRGVNPNGILDFIRDMKFKVFHLSETYRLPKKITRSTNELFSFNKNPLRKQMTTHSKEIGKVLSYQCDTEETEQKVVLHKIRYCIRNGIPCNQIAVISRNNDLVNRYKSIVPKEVWTGTIFRAKGLEFKSVFLIGAEEGTFPEIHNKNRYSKSEQIELMEEERRVFAEGVTRTSNRLYITYITSVRPNGRKGKPSPFLKEMGVTKTIKKTSKDVEKMRKPHL